MPAAITPRYALDYWEKIEKQKKNGKANEKLGFTWKFKIDLKTNKKLVFWKSTSHNLLMINQNLTAT